MFTAPMTLSKTDFVKLRCRILDLIQETSEMVKDSPSEQIAYLNIDLLQLGDDGGQ